MVERRAFRYWREPLCVGAALAYVCNTVWWKPCTEDHASFVHCYLGDVLCLPVLVPVTLWLQRKLALRGDGAPRVAELVVHWAMWSYCFEWLGPSWPLLAPGAVRDPWDTVAYAGGGALAALAWRGRRRAAPLPGGASRGALRWLARLGVAFAVAGFVLSAYRAGAALR